MDPLDEIGDRIRQELEHKEQVRDRAIGQSRALIRHCANAIRAIHRQEWDLVDQRLSRARQAADELRAGVRGHPDLYFAGYTQDALKEYVESFATYAMVRNHALPTPEALGVESNTYLNGLAEAASELRRHVLDIIRQDHTAEAERLLEVMDAVYGLLVTFDLKDAVTGGLRRRVDALRGVLKRTRGDLTLSLRQQRLQEALNQMERRMAGEEDDSP